MVAQFNGDINVVHLKGLFHPKLEIVHKLKFHKSPIAYIEESPKGTLIACFCRDEFISVWQYQETQKKKVNAMTAENL